MLKRICFVIIVFLIVVNVSWAVSSSYTATAKVIDVKDQIEDGNVTCQLIKAKILIGPYKDKIVDVVFHRLEYTSHSYYVKTGKKVLVNVHLEEGNILKGDFINVWRVDYLKELFIIFLVLLIIFGRLKGICSLISLIFSGYIIIKLLIPLIINGYDAILVSVMCSSIIIIVSFILIAGFTKKSLIAILGTVGGTLTAGVLSQIYSSLCSITGLADEDVSLLIASIGLDINFRGLYMSAVIIGTIGVVMDVSMSITSVIFEIKSKSPSISRFELMQSGLKVGKDVMSTMVNTLVLAYVGSFMPLLIIYITSNTSFLQAINTETLAVEVIRSLCGSIGLIVTIPLTCFFATYLVHTSRSKKRKKFRR